MISKYDEFCLLNEAILNEEFDINTIKNSIKSIADKNKALRYLVNRFNNAKNQPMRKHIAKLLVVVFLTSFVVKNNKWNNRLSAHEIDKITTEISYQESLSEEELAKLVGYKIEVGPVKPMFKNQELVDATKLKVKQSTVDFIKNHEKLRLKAYKLGDGKITIGWGHAERAKTSRYKVGQKITREQAESLFKKDLKIAEDGIKRIFRQWKNSGLDIKITQNMFDAMVSMAYNMGVYGIRTTEFLQHIKNGDFTSAADSIKTTKISDRFPGLADRREAEYELFIGENES